MWTSLLSTHCKWRFRVDVCCPDDDSCSVSAHSDDDFVIQIIHRLSEVESCCVSVHADTDSFMIILHINRTSFNSPYFLSLLMRVNSFAPACRDAADYKRRIRRRSVSIWREKASPCFDVAKLVCVPLMSFRTSRPYPWSDTTEVLIIKVDRRYDVRPNVFLSNATPWCDRNVDHCSTQNMRLRPNIDKLNITATILLRYDPNFDLQKSLSVSHTTPHGQVTPRHNFCTGTANAEERGESIESHGEQLHGTVPINYRGRDESWLRLTWCSPTNASLSKEITSRKLMSFTSSFNFLHMFRKVDLHRFSDQRTYVKFVTYYLSDHTTDESDNVKEYIPQGSLHQTSSESVESNDMIHPSTVTQISACSDHRPISRCGVYLDFLHQMTTRDVWITDDKIMSTNFVKNIDVSAIISMIEDSKEGKLKCSNIKSDKVTSAVDLFVSRSSSSRWNTEKKIWHDTIYDEVKVTSENNSDVLTKSLLIVREHPGALRTYHNPED